MRNHKSEVLVGVFVLVGTLLLMVMIVLFSNISDSFKRSYEVVVYFNSAAGVLPGVEVRISGVKVGRVHSVELAQIEGRDRTMVKMVLKIERDVSIRADAEFAIRNEGLISNPIIDITQKSTIGLARESVHLLPTSPKDPGYPGQVNGIDSLTMEQVLTQARDIADSVQKLLGNEQARNNLHAAVANFNTFSQRLLDITGGDMGADLHDTVRNLRDFTASAIELSAEFRKFADMMNTQTAANQEGLLKLTKQLVATTERLNKSLENVSLITDQMAQGKGSIGKFLKDDEVYKEVLNTVKTAKESLEELKVMIEILKKKGITVF